MAKARDVELDPFAPFGEAARRIIAVRGAELFEHAAGVLDTDDIERVHDMRVATRRLRAALEVFSEALPHDELKPVLRDVKRLADALGERRDPDVHIEEFTKLRAAVAVADRPGVDLLLESLRSEQAHGNEHLAAALDEMRASDLRGRIAALAAEPAQVET
jgi:CHAD domain-containing protein